MNYYKILNETECHNGFQFQDGLNIDTVPFNPTGTCLEGGIYFSRKDILTFLNYGLWIRQVTIPEDARVYKDPESSPEKWKADKIILGPRKSIDLDVIKSLVEEGADIHAWDDYALRWASEFGHFEIVKFLVEKDADIHSRGDYALRWASRNGHFEVVKFLVEKGADIHFLDNYALRCASEYDQLEVVKFLVEKGADIHVWDDYALRRASQNGHLEIVKFLIKKGADIHIREDEALIY